MVNVTVITTATVLVGIVSTDRKTYCAFDALKRLLCGISISDSN
jgi:hypothetical protein